MSEAQASTSERQRCKATRKDGAPCRGYAQRGGFCIGHTSDLAARRKGGANSSKLARADKLLPLRLRPVLELLERALSEVHQGELDPRQATAMASLSGAIVKTFEAGLIETRLTELEAKIGGNNGNRKET